MWSLCVYCVTKCAKRTGLLQFSWFWIICFFVFVSFQMSSLGAFFCPGCMFFVVCRVRRFKKKKYIIAQPPRLIQAKVPRAEVHKDVPKCVTCMCMFLFISFCQKQQRHSMKFIPLSRKSMQRGFFKEDLEWIKHLTVLHSIACTWSSPKHSLVEANTNKQMKNTMKHAKILVQLCSDRVLLTLQGSSCIFFLVFILFYF